MNTSARKRYPSDLTDRQWDNIEPLFRRGDGKTGRPRTYPLREIVNAALYLARGGCPWRLLPHDFPPWKTVSAAEPPKDHRAFDAENRLPSSPPV